MCAIFLLLYWYTYGFPRCVCFIPNSLRRSEICASFLSIQFPLSKWKRLRSTKNIIKRKTKKDGEAKRKYNAYKEARAVSCSFLKCWGFFQLLHRLYYVYILWPSFELLLHVVVSKGIRCCQWRAVCQAKDAMAKRRPTVSVSADVSPSADIFVSSSSFWRAQEADIRVKPTSGRRHGAVASRWKKKRDKNKTKKRKNRCEGIRNEIS